LVGTMNSGSTGKQLLFQLFGIDDFHWSERFSVVVVRTVAVVRVDVDWEKLKYG